MPVPSQQQYFAEQPVSAPDSDTQRCQGGRPPPPPQLLLHGNNKIYFNYLLIIYYLPGRGPGGAGPTQRLPPDGGDAAGQGLAGPSSQRTMPKILSCEY